MLFVLFALLIIALSLFGDFVKHGLALLQITIVCVALHFFGYAVPWLALFYGYIGVSTLLHLIGRLSRTPALGAYIMDTPTRTLLERANSAR